MVRRGCSGTVARAETYFTDVLSGVTPREIEFMIEITTGNLLFYRPDKLLT